MLVFFCLSQPIKVLRKESGNELRHSTIFQFIKQFWFNASISSHEARGFDTTIMARISTVRIFSLLSVLSLIIALTYHSVTHSILLLNFVQIGFIKFVTWISISCYLSNLMDFCLQKLLHGLVKIDTWISLSCYMDLPKLLHAFFKVVVWISQSCSMFLSPFVKQNRADVWPKSQSLLKLLLWKYSMPRVRCTFGNVLCCGHFSL